MKNEWLFSYKNINNYNYRLYDNRIIDIKYTFLSEYKIFLSNMIGLGLKVFYIETSPNHNIELLDSDFEFFQKYSWDSDFYENYVKKIKGYEMPENVKILRDHQSLDLIPFYDDLIAESLFIISKITDNLYHFNMVVCVKSDIELKNFLKNKFKVINIKNVTNIQVVDLTYNWMNSTFNFDTLEKFKKTEVDDVDFYMYRWKFHEINTIEKINFENYKQYCMDKNIDFSNNPIYDFYRWENAGKIAEMSDQRFIFQNESKTFGWVWFFLDYGFFDEPKFGYTYPINEGYTYIPHESEVRPMAIVNSKGDQIPIEDYEYGCMFDMIESIKDWGSPFTYNFVYVQWKKYGTTCKQRLNKNL